MFHLDSELELGACSINVADLKSMREFYVDQVGLEVLNEKSTELILGSQGVEILILKERGDLQAAPASSAGLYHTAILFNAPAGLAATLERMLRNVPDSFSGPGDHLVSVAFYFTDPEGNGLEIYYDRPRDEWSYTESGQIVMATNYYDPAQFIQENKSDSPDNSAKIGHMHLKVGDIDEARRFYVEVLGFDVTAELSTALFISVNGYHHHLGMNIWNSMGAGLRDESLGLESFEIKLSSQKSLHQLANRLTEEGIRTEDVANGFVVNDPWNNKIRFAVG